MTMERFNCEIITPMFAGDAEPAEALLRAPAFKGCLRYWWRALNGAQMPVDELRKREGRIFGRVGDEKETRRSSFALRVIPRDVRETCDGSEMPSIMVELSRDRKMNILNYLSYGPFKSPKDGYVRKWFRPGGTFDVDLRFDDRDCRDEVLRAFHAMTLFGGVGSKSRNGFGRYAIDKGPVCRAVLNTLALDGALTKFSSFNVKSVVLETAETFASWEACLGKIGIAYRDARLAVEPRHTGERRRRLASPLAIDRQEVSPKGERRAKPVFLSVLREEGRYRGMIVYLASSAFTADPKHYAENGAQHQEVCEALIAHLVRAQHENKPLFSQVAGAPRKAAHS